ncbi:hypothetical protein [Haladaptatus sp. NG-WS-4]
MKALGSLAALAGVQGFVGRGRGVQSGESVLTITAPYGSETFYQFQVTGGVRKLSSDPYGTVPAGAVTVDGEDDVNGCLVHGATNGGADVYAISGEVTYANLSGTGKQDGTARVYWNGQDVSGSFERGTPPSSDTNTDCGHRRRPASTVVCDGTRATTQVQVTVQATQQVWYDGQPSDIQTVLVSPGERAEIDFDGALVCLAIDGGDLDVQIRYRGDSA